MPLYTNVELTDLDLSSPYSQEETILSYPSHESVESRASLATPDAMGSDPQVSDARSSFYAALAADKANELREAAIRVRASMGSVARSMLDIGRELITIRREMNGNFEVWLRLEFAMSRASAYHYMNVATQFSDCPHVVESLPATTIYKLAAKSTPVEVRDEVVREITAGETLSADDVESRIEVAISQAKKEKRVEDERLTQGRLQQRLDDKAKELAHAGRSEDDLAEERMKCELAMAPKEHLKQQREAEQQRLMEDDARKGDAETHTASLTAGLLRKHLPNVVFETLRGCATASGSWNALARQLGEFAAVGASAESAAT